mmetsp:Transcript_84035/g.146219  ORF Transcript_84035/g.146219 Transcript_84035/m.146219 type:complete len:223 (-) Transcript_84035:264-932(-)
MSEEFVLQPDDIKREGFLLKQSKVLKNWRARWLVLTPQYLYAFKSQGDYHNPTEVLCLTDCSCVESADKETGTTNSFCVITPSRTFLLVASSAAEKEQWMSEITSSCVPMVCSSRRSPCIPLDAILEDDDEEADDDDKISAEEDASITKLAELAASLNKARLTQLIQRVPIDMQHILDSLLEPSLRCKSHEAKKVQKTCSLKVQKTCNKELNNDVRDVLFCL